MFWKILKIEPTADRKEITAAYRKLLAVTSPEDDQEAFMELRQAYETALAYAASHAENTELTPAECWKRDLEELYDNFRKRNDVDAWRKLFNEDVCVSLDTRMECEETLLKFLMEKYFITHDVWVCFDEQFSWLERKEELSGTYPPEFVEYVVINGILYPDILPMKMFEPGRDGDACNAYLQLYLQIMRGENTSPEALDELLSMPEQHPYGTALCLSDKAELTGDPEPFEKLKEMQRDNPEDAAIGMTLTELLYKKEMYEECLALAEEMYKLYPEKDRFLWYQALCHGETGNYSQAVKYLDQMLGEAGTNGRKKYDVDQKRREINEKIIEDLEKKMDGDTEDETRMELAWAYLENDQFEKAKQIVENVSDAYEDRFNYLNLRSYIEVALNNPGEAAGLLKELIDVIQTIPEDSEKNIRRRGRLSEVYSRLGSALYSLDHEKSMEAYEQALAVSKKPEEILDQLSYIYLHERKYEKAAETARRQIEIDPGGYSGYLTLAYAYFFRHMDRDAYNAVLQSLERNPSELQMHVLKARILFRNEAEEGAREIVDYLMQCGLEEETSVLFLRGVLAEDVDKDPAKAEEFFERSLKQADENTTSETYKSELIYRYMYLAGDHMNANEEKDRAYLLSLAEQGLEVNPDHYGLQDYKAWLLKRGGQFDEALKIYLKMAENPEHGASLDAEIGHIYYQDVSKHADLALKYYLQSLAKGGSASGHFYAGMCYMYMLNTEQAKEQFELLKEKEPDSVDSWFRLSYVFAMENDAEKALEYADRSIDIIREYKGDQSKYFYHKSHLLRRLGRFDEAIEAIREAERLYGNEDGKNEIFRILCQAGRFAEAGEYLKAWAEEDKTDEDLCDCGILLHMYQNDFDSAFLEYKYYGKYLEKDRALEVPHILSRWHGDYKKECRELRTWLEFRKKNGVGDLSRVSGALAMCCFRLGDMENAKLYAEEALAEIDEILKEYETDRLLFMARKIRLLALLGRKEEALEAAEECGRLPMCQFCPERSCKDLALFSMETEEIFGNPEKVCEMAVKGHEQFPDEEEFLIEMNMAKKKDR